ncbi:hypothetical protein ACQCSX_13305 [Pseudarthrobacter sp. P1]|uniref:hypothetical protein n=1 Tax=Pseudarthrobacter sp. P1 TaxID=3418418 RepID=UPI003CEAD8E1
MPKQPAAMLTKYHESVGRNAVLLLNVPPTTAGRLAPSSATALAGFTAERAKAFTQDFALGRPATVDGGSTALLTDGNFRTGAAAALAAGTSVVIDLGSPQPVDRIALTEDVLNHGQNVEAFTVEAAVDGGWRQVGGAGSIGVLRIVEFADTAMAAQFRVTVTQTPARARLANISLYGTLATAPAPVMELYVDCTAPTAGTGSQERPFNSLEQFRQTEIAAGTTIYFRAGTNCAASDTPFWGYGTTDAPITVTTYGGGGPAHIGGVAVDEALSALAAQGWVFGPPQEPKPAGPVDPRGAGG